MNEKVLAETKLAYCDLTEPWEEAVEKRNLNFRASEPVPPGMAIEIMQQATPTGYNDFRPELLAFIPNNCQITLAREGSVCIYVKPKLPRSIFVKLKADEFHTENGETRIWWD